MSYFTEATEELIAAVDEDVIPSNLQVPSTSSKCVSSCHQLVYYSTIIDLTILSVLSNLIWTPMKTFRPTLSFRITEKLSTKINP